MKGMLARYGLTGAVLAFLLAAPVHSATKNSAAERAAAFSRWVSAAKSGSSAKLGPQLLTLARAAQTPATEENLRRKIPL